VWTRHSAKRSFQLVEKPGASGWRLAPMSTGCGSIGSLSGSSIRGTALQGRTPRSCSTERPAGRAIVCLASPPRKYKPRGLQAAVLEHTLPPAEFTLPHSDAPAHADTPSSRRASRARMATAATTGAVGAAADTCMPILLSREVRFWFAAQAHASGLDIQ